MKSRVIILGLLTVTTVCFTKQQTAPPNSPIELPEFLVTGKEAVDVAAGAKHAPQRPPLLSATTLDSLNPTEKQPIPPLPARPLPLYVRPTSMWPGYLQAEFGNYVSPSILAGYSFVASGYRLDFSGDIESSNGWVDNASYLVGGLRLLSSYVAPEKFIIFGGSTTQVDLGFRNRSYHLFARPDALNRSHSSLNAGVDVEGRAESISYQALASWESQSLSTVSMRNVSDNVLRGKIRLEQQWKSADVGLFLDTRMQTYASNSYPFVEVGAYGRWVTESLRLTGGGGLQWATSTSGIDRFGLSLVGQADLMVGPDVTIVASVRSGMRTITFKDLVLQNPWIDDSVSLDAAYDIVDLRGTITYHPSVRTSVSAGMRIRQTDREPVWQGARQGLFSVSYRTVSLIEINADARLIVSPRDVVSADLHLVSATVAGASSQPYVPGIRLSADYQRTFTAALRAGIGIVYQGRRYADLENVVSLAGYADVRLQASYIVSRSFDVQARVENLLGSTIVLWDGYRERGVFVTAGITWKF